MGFRNSGKGGYPNICSSLHPEGEKETDLRFALREKVGSLNARLSHARKGFDKKI